MQSTTATAHNASPDTRERNRAWLVAANRHWSAEAITAGEFAMQAVGRLLLEDIATSTSRPFGSPS